MVPLATAFGIVITTLTLCGGGIIAGTWWASNISAKLDFLVKQGNELAVSTTLVGARVTALELWSRGIDSSGSPSVKIKLDEICKDLSGLRRDFDIHKVTDSRTKP